MKTSKTKEKNRKAIVNGETSASALQKISFEKFKLIEGTFSPSDAETILTNEFDSKIQFHSLQAFGKEERGETDLLGHCELIKQLRGDLNGVKYLLKQAYDLNRKVMLSSIVTIKIG